MAKGVKCKPARERVLVQGPIKKGQRRYRVLPAAKPERSADKKQRLYQLMSSQHSETLPSQHVQQGRHGAEWAVNVSNAASPLVYASADGKEGHFLLPDSNNKSFGFVGYRFVGFSDGEKLVSWCEGTNCSNPTGLRSSCSGNDYLHSGSLEFLSGSPTACSCSQALIDSFGGPAKLKLLLADKGNSDHAMQQQHTHGGKRFTIVRGCDFKDLGILEHTSTGALCRTCARHKHHCPHVVLLRTEGSAPEESSAYMSAEKFEASFGQFFDFSEGAEKITCLSQLAIPQELSSDPHLLSIYTGKALAWAAA